jgi:site-specific DNA-methyltransferase (adenine-specific)
MVPALIHGDCVEAMREMPEASVDAVVCDPPYGLEFMGKEWDRLTDQRWHETWATEALRVLRPGGHLLAFGGTRTYHRLACAIEDAGFEIRDCLAWLYGSGFPKSLNLNGDREGWGTALKPAHEPIVLARKPLVGTVAANVEAHGTGALNVDGCRVGLVDGVDDSQLRTMNRSEKANDGWGMNTTGADEPQVVNPQGRWPSNVLLDPEAGAMLDEQSGEQKSGTAIQRNGGGRALFGGIAGNEGDGPAPDAGYGDSGGASRFFYTAKASRAERNAGLEVDVPNDRFRTRICEGCGKNVPAQGACGCDAPIRWEAAQPTRNVHPTVKPIALMRWLCRLVTPPGGTILDPFAGSGTTGCAAVLEGFEFVGTEREAEYVALAEARIKWWATHKGREAEEVLAESTKSEREQEVHRASGQMGLLG